MKKVAFVQTRVPPFVPLEKEIKRVTQYSEKYNRTYRTLLHQLRIIYFPRIELNPEIDTSVERKNC